MSEESFVLHSAPTLAGIKTANLFMTRNDNHDLVMNGIRHLNQLLTAKGIRVIPLKESKESILIYVYRPSCLIQDFQNESLQKMLENLQYPTSNPDQCVVKLAQRLKECKSFPHEIGLLLGYPPVDVAGFMENNGERFLYSGYWKVYGNLAETLKVFEQYDRAREYVIHMAGSGRAIREILAAS